MILFSTVGDRASISGNSHNLLLNLNLNLVYETLWTGNESDLLTNFSPTSHFILSENVRNPYISDVFREHRNGTLGSNVLIGKTEPLSFDCSNNAGTIDVKPDESVLDEKLPFTAESDCG